MDYTIRPATSDEIPAMQETMGFGFGFDPMPELRELFAATVELDRTRCAFEGATLVGTSGAFSLDLTVPGGSLPTGGTTMVAVRSSHRRQGLLRAMMSAHLDDVQERGEPLAALWASESAIYGRFGYGPAAYLQGFEIERVHSAFSEPVAAPGRFRLIDAEEACKLLPQIYDAVCTERPGHFARSSAWWERRRTFDPSWGREGASAYRFLVYEQDGRARGYLQYRVKPEDQGLGLPAGRLLIEELQGLDQTSRTALWRYALDVDLIATITAWNQPLDDELPWLLADSRRLKRSVTDSLWVRVMDVPAALAGRRYSSEGRLALRVHDEISPQNDGTWQLDGGPDGATCERCSAQPEIGLRAVDLGALYLGGNGFQTLARAGRIEGSPQALARADAMFTWHPVPWCPEIF